jgi:septal ring factor EnvC (AmiA/AmiB activator)
MKAALASPLLLLTAQEELPMRTILWSTVLSVALLGSVGCKKDEADKVKAAEKNVDEQRQDIREEQKDVDKQKQELTEAKIDLAQARTEYERVTRERLAKIDAKIAQLDAKGDEKSKKAAADLRVRRDQAAAKLNDIGNRTEANWGEFKTDVDRDLTQFEKDVDDATR